MGNMTLEQVNDMYLDVLREIGNIGAGNATSAIANMLGMKIDMNVPSIRLMEVSQLGNGGQERKMRQLSAFSLRWRQILREA